MGIPALFRWVHERYPKTVTTVVEDEVQTINGVTIPIDISQPNPNGQEFDNLYLDLNGIVHPCCHPEDKAAPETEEDMMIEIFKYLDRVMAMVRPRKLLYIAIDGVAPRAKMNQQRSRRFRAGLDARNSKEEKERLIAELTRRGEAPEIVEKRQHFDSNCITPGTPFMDKLSNCLKYYIADKLNNDPAWRNISVIFSDSSYPGEGEHKIVDYIRRMRCSPGHDPNTQHVLYGLDADLIMLSLATHEPHFKILREDVSQRKVKKGPKCLRCGNHGHSSLNCRNSNSSSKNSEVAKPAKVEPFLFFHVNVFREYLEVELKVNNLIFKYDFENAIDDWIFLMFFVGNDFLPHLPTVNIRENAVDKLIKMWKNSLNQMGGFITKAGDVNLERAQVILSQLASMEDGILHQRQVREKRFEQRNAYNNQNKDDKNKAAALELKASLANDQKQDGKRTREEEESNEANDAPTKVTKLDPEPIKSNFIEDVDVRLGQPGYKERYYLAKFGVPETDTEFPAQVAKAYMEGLCWVLKYYFQGCRSWKWYYPYHYPPFASDFVDIGKYEFNFELGEPSRPFEQLMSVLPSDSKQHLPKPFHFLMEDPESPILDFYPLNFKLDMNGAKADWLAVILLPFIDEARLLGAINEVYPQLTPDEHRRNKKGHELLFVSQHNPLYDSLLSLYSGSKKLDIDPEISKGVSGNVKKDSNCKPNETYFTPLPGKGPLDIPNDTCLSVVYIMPKFPNDYIFHTNLLPGVKKPARKLTQGDIDVTKNGGTRNFGRHDYQRHEYYKGRENYERQTHHDLVQDGFINDANAPEGYNRFFPSAQQTRPRPHYNDNFQNFNNHNPRGGFNQRGGHNQRGGGYNSGRPDYGYNFAPHGQSNNDFQSHGNSHQNFARPRGQHHQNRSLPQGPPQIGSHSQRPNPFNPPRGNSSRGGYNGRGGHY